MSQQRAILLLSGPNLNLLGSRQPEIYGTDTIGDHAARAAAVAGELGYVLEHAQFNAEGALVDRIHAARGTTDAIIINPGAFTHYAWSVHDALAAYDGVVIELHLSNTGRREAWRHTSVVSPVADAILAGLGAAGYPLAVRAAHELLMRQQQSSQPAGTSSSASVSEPPLAISSPTTPATGTST